MLLRPQLQETLILPLLQVLCAPIPSPSLHPVTSGDIQSWNLEAEHLLALWVWDMSGVGRCPDMGWLLLSRSKGEQPVCRVRPGSFTADNKWLEMSAGVFVHAKM